MTATTRREKRHEARSATEKALRQIGGVKTVGDEACLHGEILSIIRRHRLAAFPIDHRDVALAVRWLHRRGIVRVRHYGPEYEREHSVMLLRP